jgi:signal transduction histidine kinase
VNLRRLASSRRGTALAAAVLILGLATGATAAATLTAAEGEASTAALALRAAGARSALDGTFQRYADTMHDLVAAAATQPAAALAPTVARLVGERLPGAHEVLVVGADRTVITQHAVDGSTPPLRRSLGADADLTRAMDLSRISGRVVATPAHVLPADRELPPAVRQPAFALAAPVGTPDTGFRGWVLVSLRAPDLLESSLRAAGVTGVALVLTETSPDGATHEVTQWSAGGTAIGDRHVSVDVALAGHVWQIQVRPTTALLTPVRAAADTVTLLGTTVVSLLIAVLVLAVSADRDHAVTRARRADEERRGDAERAHRVEETLRAREAELAGFAAAAGQNLHAPLHNIASFTDLLLEEAAPHLDGTSRGFLDRIGRNTTKMLTLVDDLMAYTATTDVALRLEPVDAGRLAAAAVAEQFDNLPGERPSVDVGPLPLVTADAALLRQVLDQLLSNAVRFMRHGTGARITVGARPDADGRWRIEVADRGIGVPAEHRDRIFAPFYRTPAAEGFPGAGLGLAICQRIVALHGGEIGVESNPGGGSIFFFTLIGADAGHPAGEHPQVTAGHA